MARSSSAAVVWCASPRLAIRSARRSALLTAPWLRSTSTGCNTVPTSAFARCRDPRDERREAFDMDLTKTRAYFLALQRRIVAALESVDGATFRRDEWARSEGGGGVTCAIENGNVLERGGVLFSHVTGTTLPPSATAHRPDLAGRAWEAMGVSLVLHPRNPYAPTVHLNVRMFVAHADAAADSDIWWFGGGMDLTPYYGFDEDAVHFHRSCRDALAPFGAEVYGEYKR